MTQATATQREEFLKRARLIVRDKLGQRAFPGPAVDGKVRDLYKAGDFVRDYICAHAGVKSISSVQDAESISAEKWEEILGRMEGLSSQDLAEELIFNTPEVPE